MSCFVELKESKTRVSYSFDKSLVSYSERKVYHFEEMLSTASLDHNITVINLQMMVNDPILFKGLINRNNNYSLGTEPDDE